MKTIIKTVGVVLMTVFLMASSDVVPTYRGLVCVGWVKPESQAIADGDSEGEALVVNTTLSESEKRQLYYARQEEDAAMHKESAVEESILASHHLLFPLAHGSDWLRGGMCGDTPMIRANEYHITQFVPSNPKYPGEGNWRLGGKDASTCRAYFIQMRKRAVKAEYGSTERYIPKE